MAHEVKDSLETSILDNNSNNILHRMSCKVQCSANTAGKLQAVSKQTIEMEEFQTQIKDAKAAKKLSDQMFKDPQVKLSAEKGMTCQKHGRVPVPASPLLVAMSSGCVVAPP
jgi:hypothetical protein